MKDYGLRAQTIASVAMGVDTEDEAEMNAFKAVSSAFFDELTNDYEEPLVPPELIRGLAAGQMPRNLGECSG